MTIELTPDEVTHLIGAVWAAYGRSWGKYTKELLDLHDRLVDLATVDNLRRGRESWKK